MSRPGCIFSDRSLTGPVRYDFEYEDDDDDDDPTDDVNLENKYYNAKQIKATSPEEALEEFLGVPAQEAEKGNW